MYNTSVYCSTKVDAQVDLALSPLGPATMGARLSSGSLSAQAPLTEIMQIFRALDRGTYILDTSFSIAGTYLASAQVMLRGHSFGSMIWWRWRTATADIGRWVTDHTPHSTTVSARGHDYTFTLTGVSAVGYDDLNISLAG